MHHNVTYSKQIQQIGRGGEGLNARFAMAVRLWQGSKKWERSYTLKNMNFKMLLCDKVSK